MITETEEKLGPIDLGSSPDWVHLRKRNPDGSVSNFAVCGEDRTGVPVSYSAKGPKCPDCVRIAGSR